MNLFSRKILCPKRLASLSSGSRLDANEISFLASMHNDRVTPTPRPDVFDHLFIITQLANPRRRRRLLPIEAPFVVRSGLRPNPIMDSCYAKTPTTSNRAVHPSSSSSSLILHLNLRAKRVCGFAVNLAKNDHHRHCKSL